MSFRRTASDAMDNIVKMTAAEQAWAEARVAELVESLLFDAPVLEIVQARGPGGALVVDCGVSVRGSWEAGRRLAVISHAGMMNAAFGVSDVTGMPLAELLCDSWRPPLSTYGLQVSFALADVDAAIRISGPVRAAIDGAFERPARRAGGIAPWGVAVVESDRLPDEAVVASIARRAGMRSRDLTLLVVPSVSLAGVAQIAGRLNECVLFTLAQSLGLDPEAVVGIVGAVPLAPCGREAPVAQDDMIHYAGRVAMVVDAPADWNLQAVADGLVFRSSAAYGRLFSELLAEAGGVFEAIPGLSDLNKVARITLVDRRSGRTATAGAVNRTILARAAGAPEGSRDGSD
jgi:methenyltetrahydromethanopterin cyclohydrolase